MELTQEDLETMLVLARTAQIRKYGPALNVGSVFVIVCSPEEEPTTCTVRFSDVQAVAYYDEVAGTYYGYYGPIFTRMSHPDRVFRVFKQIYETARPRFTPPQAPPANTSTPQRIEQVVPPPPLEPNTGKPIDPDLILRKLEEYAEKREAEILSSEGISRENLPKAEEYVRSHYPACYDLYTVFKARRRSARKAIQFLFAVVSKERYQYERLLNDFAFEVTGDISASEVAESIDECRRSLSRKSS